MMQFTYVTERTEDARSAFLKNQIIDALDEGKIINASLKQGVFPSTWKRSQFIALKKVSAPSNPSDFRPIALLSFLFKVLEKLAHDQITEYLMGAGHLDPLQTGFQRFNSTETALLKLNGNIKIGINENMVTFLLLLDFSKAFETLSPSRLIRKLQGMGFSRTALM